MKFNTLVVFTLLFANQFSFALPVTLADGSKADIKATEILRNVKAASMEIGKISGQMRVLPTGNVVLESPRFEFNGIQYSVHADSASLEGLCRRAGFKTYSWLESNHSQESQRDIVTQIVEFDRTGKVLNSRDYKAIVVDALECVN